MSECSSEMITIICLTFLTFHHSSAIFVNSTSHFHGDEVTELIHEFGYNVEVHNLVTSDGYILRIHRLLPGDESNEIHTESRPPVFMLHGLFSSSGQFVHLGPGKSLGFFLVNHGYDVWMGSMRGGKYGMKHKYLSSESDKFWDFTLEDVANIDVAEQIDFIRSETNSYKIFVTGVAVSTIPITILLCEKPEYNDKIVQASFLSPVLWVGHKHENQLNTIILQTLTMALKFLPYFQFSEFEQFLILFRDNFCKHRTNSDDFCIELYFLQSLLYGNSGYHNMFELVSWVRWNCRVEIEFFSSQDYFKDFEKFSTPRFGSKFLRHILQMKINRSFGRFEDGYDSYYDLKNIRIPIRLQRGRRDKLMNDEVSWENLKKRIIYFTFYFPQDYYFFWCKAKNSNVTVHTIESYAHGEVVYGKDVTHAVFVDVLEAMEYEKVQDSSLFRRWRSNFKLLLH